LIRIALKESLIKVRRKLGWVSLYLVIIFFAISSKGWGFLISPPRLDIEILAGEEREFSLYLANPQERDNIRVKVYTEDFFLRRDGSLEFLRPGSLKSSCAQWIKFEDTEVVLKAGEEKKIYGKIKVPQDSSGGRYALVMVELVPLLAGEGNIFPVCIRDFKGVIPELLSDGEYTGEAEINFTLENNRLIYPPPLIELKLAPSLMVKKNSR